VTSEINPGCTSCKETWIIHSVSLGKEDAIHHLWGFVGAPTFIIVKTKPNTQLHVNWTSLQDGLDKSIHFTPTPLYVFGMALPNVILFNDVDDSGTFGNDSSIQEIIPMMDFSWELAKGLTNTSRRVEIKAETNQFKDQVLNNSKITIQLSCTGEEGRSKHLPHLLETSTSSQMDIILDHFILDINSSKESFNYDHARWAFDIIFFTNNPKLEEFKIKSSKSLDDENTPGIFDMEEITAPSDGVDNKGGYLQWRPVSYLKNDRDVNYATKPNINQQFSLLKNISSSVQKSLVYALLGEDLLDLSSVSTDVSFGMSNDGYYTKYNYTTWTLALGYGNPPSETFSTLVIVVICVGVGLPTLMFLIGGIVLLVRKLNPSQETPLISN
ncbi:unnamed protein product, partial [Meganyctiphanes norvegica]